MSASSVAESVHVRTAHNLGYVATRPARVAHGAVFTRAWVVDHMLDAAGYRVDRDLARERVLEPSVGGGAFAERIVERLIASRATHAPDTPWVALADCLRGWDLQPHHVDTVRKNAVVALVDAGCPQSDAEGLAETWFRVGDFLLADLEGWTATLVVGNPPYIRIEDVPADLLEQYRAACPAMIGRADVYVGFIARGLELLAANGRLVFVCADRWMHNAYGKALRRLVIDRYAIDSELKLHGVDAFEGDVDAYPAITVIRRGKQASVAIGDARAEFGPADAAEFLAFTRSRRKSLRRPALAAARLPGWHTTDELWPQGSPELLAWLTGLRKRHEPLERGDSRTVVRIGVATGLDEVYIVGPDNLPTIEPDRLLPLATSDDVKSGTFRWTGHHLVDPWLPSADLIKLSDFPKTARYLRRHKADLASRHIVRHASDKTAWHKTIDRVHHERSQRPYLAFEDLKAYAHPVLIPAGFYPHHSLYAIMSEDWDLDVLGGILISEVFERQVAAYCVRMRGGTLRFQAQYLRMCRVPAPESISPDVAADLGAAFRARDRARATAAALLAYGIAAVPAG